MKRLLIALVAVLALAAAASAQDWARAKVEQSPRHHEWDTITYNGRTLYAYVAYPQANGKRPVVLVIHEIFGMSDWIEDMTDQLAAAGYVAIAPDLLSGMGPGGGRSDAFASQSEVTAAVGKLPPDQITADLNHAADYALALPASNGKLMVVGFCWGGGQSFRFATDRPDLRAAFVFYGVPPGKDAMARIHAPVYGFYAGNDYRISGTVPATQADMKALGKTYAAVVYPGAGHGFMRLGEAPPSAGTGNDAATDDANRKAHDQAWARWTALLKKGN